MKKKNIRLIASVNIRAAEGGKPRRFHILAYNGGELRLTGLKHPMVVDLAGLTIPENVPILIDHAKAVEATLGMADSIENTGTQLVLAGNITAVSPKALAVLAQSDAGHAWQASIGATATVLEEVEPGEVVYANGQKFVGPIYVARQSVLRETSVLPMGADASTVVNLAAVAAGIMGVASMPTFEEWLASLGIDPATLNEDGKALMMAQYQAAQAATPPADGTAVPEAAAVPGVKPAVAAAAALDVQAGGDAFQRMRSQNASELRRIAEINAKCGGHHLIAAKAIEEGWDGHRAELEVLKATRAKAPAAHIHSRSTNAAVIEAAVCMSAGLPNIEKRFKPEVLEAAHRDYRGIGLQQVIIMAASANGWSCGPGQRLHNGNFREAIEYAFPQRGNIQAAGFSTMSLPGILSNVANKEILTGYEEEDQSIWEIAVPKSVSDFKAVTSYRMLDDMQYEEVGPTGEIHHGSLGQESYTRQAKTFAKMFGLSRVDIINDDLGAFDDLRKRLGAGAMKKLNERFWTAFINNSSFFTTARGNYITGATTTLLVDGVGLGLGVKAFRQLRSPTADGTKRVGMTFGGSPDRLIVPPELESAADQLFVSTNVATGGAENTFRNKYRPVVVSQLSDATFTGYSATAWYLLRSPSNLSAAVVSFLNGQKTPTVESADAAFNFLGVEFRGYHDFGVDMAEYLCGVKSKGAA